MARRITSAKVTRLALCKQGKNGFDVLYKSKSLDDNDSEVGFDLQMLTKGMTEQGELTAVVYAPERADSDGHLASARVIKEAAYGFLRDGPALNIEHAGAVLKKSDAHVAESFLIAEGDKRFEGMLDYSGRPVGDLTGAWAVVVKIENEALRKAYRTGEFQGISLEGFGKVEMLKSEEDRNEGSDTMTPAEIAALTKSITDSVTGSFKPVVDRVEALEKSLTAKKDEADEAKQEKLKKSKRLARQIVECTSDKEADLILAKAEVSNLAEQYATAIENGDTDEVSDLRKSLKAAREDVTKLEKAVEEENAKNENLRKSDTAPLGSDQDGMSRDSKMKAIGQFVGLNKSIAAPDQQEAAFEAGFGTMIGTIATKLAGMAPQQPARKTA